MLIEWIIRFPCRVAIRGYLIACLTQTARPISNSNNCVPESQAALISQRVAGEPNIRLQPAIYTQDRSSLKRVGSACTMACVRILFLTRNLFAHECPYSFSDCS